MNRTRTALIVVVLVALTVILASCGASSPSNTGSTGGAGSGGGVTVTEKGFAFSPASVTVKVGDTVTFTNEDSAPHEVTIDGKDLGSQTQGASVTWKAEKAGTFPYSCVIHPSMTGEVTVE